MKRTLAVLLLLPSLTHALTIERIFLGGTPATNIVGRVEDFEPVFNAAADIWETIIHDEHRLRLYYEWGPVEGAAALHTLLAIENGRETVGLITIDNDNSGVGKRWLDPTPYDTSEYTQRQDAEYQGVNCARLLIQPTGLAVNLDLYSIFEHEIGHSLGLTTALPAFLAAVTNGYIIIQPPLPYAGLEILLAQNSAGVVPHISYLVDFYGPIMQGINAGERRMPTVMDILLIAQCSGFTNLNLNLQPTLQVMPGPMFSWSAHAEGFSLVSQREGQTWEKASVSIVKTNGQYFASPFPFAKQEIFRLEKP